MAVVLEYNTGDIVRTIPTGGFTGDPDWVELQDLDGALAAGTFEYPRNRGIVSFAVTVQLYDADGNPNTAAGRGSFGLTAVRLPLTSDHASDGLTVSVPAWRRVIVGDSSGAPARMTVRVSSPVIPAGTAEIRLYVEALR